MLRNSELQKHKNNITQVAALRADLLLKSTSASELAYISPELCAGLPNPSATASLEALVEKHFCYVAIRKSLKTTPGLTEQAAGKCRNSRTPACPQQSGSRLLMWNVSSSL